MRDKTFDADWKSLKDPIFEAFADPETIFITTVGGPFNKWLTVFNGTEGNRTEEQVKLEEVFNKVDVFSKGPLTTITACFYPPLKQFREITTSSQMMQEDFGRHNM